MPSAVELVGTISHLLSQPLEALTAAKSTQLTNAVNSLDDKLEELEGNANGFLSEDVASSLVRLIPPLASFSVAHAAGPYTRPSLVQLSDAAGCLLHLLMELAVDGRLQLSEADALRLLSAAPIVLRLQTQMLRIFAESLRDKGIDPEEINDTESLKHMLNNNCQAVAQLIVLAFERGSPLPPRALAAARATSLRPQALFDWLVGPGSMLDCIAAFRNVVGPDIQPPLLFVSVDGLLRKVATGVAALLRQDTGEQLAVVTAAADSIRLSGHTECPCAPPVGDANWCQLVDTWCRVAADPALAAGRRRYLRRPDNVLLRSTAAAFDRLLLTLEQQQQEADGDSSGNDSDSDICSFAQATQADLVLSSLELVSQLWEDINHDIQDRDATGGFGALQLTECLPHLNTTLRAVRRLCGHLAAAAAPAPALPGPASSGPAADEAGTAMTAVACLLWCYPELPFNFSSLAVALHDIAIELQQADASLLQQEHAVAAAECAAEALRLAPLLPRVPHWEIRHSFTEGGSTQNDESAAGAPTVAAGTRALPPSVDGDELVEGNPAQALAMASHLLADALLDAVVRALHASSASGRHRLAADGMADAAFDAALAAVRYEWAAAKAEAVTASGAEVPVFVLSTDLALHSACQAAAAAHVVLHVSNPGNVDLLRRLDCLAVLYLCALEARPNLSHNPALEDRSHLGRLTCLTALLTIPKASPDLVLRFGGPSALVRAVEAEIEAQLKADSPAGSSSPSLLLTAVQSCPVVLPTLLASPVLLRALGRLAAKMPADAEEAGSLLKLGRQLVHESRIRQQPNGLPPAADSQPSAAAAPAGRLGHFDASTADLSQLAALLAQAAEQAPSDNPAEGATSRAVPADLVLRRAQALAMRTSCANPRCANMEAPPKGLRCSGCTQVRYCSEECGKAAWPEHKAACRLLRQQRQQGSG